ncbi:expressed unknown protein [Seminavis robusta]|uniref:Uncharacterized protein n=1 Tax=Seminavis robusta TaxID=568900 RepID=A0A9N8E3P2_9STRA|nr:expressed unknown protein [Seminavis robusta]|eukprot:Sro626_g177750.1 n/a (498) ;mRNA; f:18688-20181
MSLLDPTFFPRYDDLAKELRLLDGVETLLKDAQTELEKERAALAQSESELASLNQFAEEQRERIQLVRTHCFYGSTALQPQLWLRGGTRGKIRRAQAKLETCEQERRPLIALIQQLHDEILPPLLSRVERLQAEQSDKQFLEDCQSQMRDLAVELHPSRTYQQLTQKIESQEQKVQETQHAVEAVHRLVEQCAKAKLFYHRAENRLQEAKKLNRSGTLGDCDSTPTMEDSSPTNDHGRQSRTLEEDTEDTNIETEYATTTTTTPEELPPNRRRRSSRQSSQTERHDNTTRNRQEDHARVEARRERLKQQARDEFQNGVDTLKRSLANANCLPPPVKAQYPALCHPLERAARQDFRTVKNHVGLEQTGTEILEHGQALHSQLHADQEAAGVALRLAQAAKEDEKDRIVQELRLLVSSQQSVVSPPRAVTVIASGTAGEVGVPVVVARPVADTRTIAASDTEVSATDDTVTIETEYVRDSPKTAAATVPHPEPSAPVEK